MVAHTETQWYSLTYQNEAPYWGHIPVYKWSIEGFKEPRSWLAHMKIHSIECKCNNLLEVTIWMLKFDLQAGDRYLW